MSILANTVKNEKMFIYIYKKCFEALKYMTEYEMPMNQALFMVGMLLYLKTATQKPITTY